MSIGSYPDRDHCIQDLERRKIERIFSQANPLKAFLSIPLFSEVQCSKYPYLAGKSQNIFDELDKFVASRYQRVYLLFGKSGAGATTILHQHFKVQAAKIMESQRQLTQLGSHRISSCHYIDLSCYSSLDGEDNEFRQLMDRIEKGTPLQTQSLLYLNGYDEFRPEQQLAVKKLIHVTRYKLVISSRNFHMPYYKIM